MQVSIDAAVQRMEKIRKEVAHLGPMLIGTLLQKHNRKLRKDGSEYVSPPYFTFQYTGTDGKRAWKRIPRSLKKRVEALCDEGKRYRELENEYAAIGTEVALLEPLKKTARDTKSSSPKHRTH